MKIIIASGVFPPDIGGPANYVERLANELRKKDINLEVITYSDSQINKSYDFPITKVSRKGILPWRYFSFFWTLFKASNDSDIIYALDLFSCGLPASLVKKIRRKKIAVRLSGDFLWEKAIEKGWSKKPLSQYYQEPKNYQEKLLLWIGQRVLKAADSAVFTTDWQKEIYLENYKISRDKIKVVQNPFPEKESTADIINNQKIIFAGRLIKLKNIDFLIRAFNNLLVEHQELQLEIIGQGPQRNNLEKLVSRLNLEKNIVFKRTISYQQLVKEISQSFLVIIPSLSEVSPNLALQCIKLKKPILLTKETGFYEKFKNNLIFINPFNQKDLENKLKYLLVQENYQKYQEKISRISTDYSWPEVIKQHLDIFNQKVG